MPTNGFSTKPLKDKLLAGEQKATKATLRIPFQRFGIPAATHLVQARQGVDGWLFAGRPMPLLQFSMAFCQLCPVRWYSRGNHQSRAFLVVQDFVHPQCVLCETAAFQFGRAEIGGPEATTGERTEVFGERRLSMGLGRGTCGSKHASQWPRAKGEAEGIRLHQTPDWTCCGIS